MSDFRSASPRRHAALQHSIEQSTDSQELATVIPGVNVAACVMSCIRGGAFHYLYVYLLYVSLTLMRAHHHKVQFCRPPMLRTGLYMSMAPEEAVCMFGCRKFA